LAELDNINIHPETLRLWLLKKGLWQRKRKRKGHRKKRTRRERFGELLQIDGSDHAWFGPDKPRCCLLNIVDDATSTTMSRMDKGETCRVLMSTLLDWIKTYGVPKSVYVDLKSLYVSPRREVDDDIEVTMIVFERVCHLLDIEVIKAYSPQAKGRVERNHAIYQDRFVKELKLNNITTIEQANDFLKRKYLKEVNEKFAKEPIKSEDAHCSAEAYGDLEQIFCWEYHRVVRNDFTIRFDNNFYQLDKNRKARLREKDKVMVHVHLNGEMSLWKNGERLSYTKIVEPRVNKQEEKKAREYTSGDRSENARKNKSKTPWSQYNKAWLKSGSKSREAMYKVAV